MIFQLIKLESRCQLDIIRSCTQYIGCKHAKQPGARTIAHQRVSTATGEHVVSSCSRNSAPNYQRSPGTGIRRRERQQGWPEIPDTADGERQRPLVDLGGRRHAHAALRRDRGHSPQPPVLQLRRQQQVDEHAHAVRRGAASAHPAAPGTAAAADADLRLRRGGAAPAGTGGVQAGGRLRGHRHPDRLRQPHVRVRAAVPAGVHLLAGGGDAAGLQRRHVVAHQRAAVHGAHRQLRGRAHLRRRAARRRLLLRRHLLLVVVRRAAGQVRGRVRPHAGRLRHVRAHPVAARARLRQGGQGAHAPVGAHGADAHQPRGVGGVGAGDARVRGVADDPGGDGGVQGREDQVRPDAGRDGGVVAGGAGGAGAAHRQGVVALRQRRGRRAAPARARVRRAAVRRQDDGHQGRRHAHGRVGIPLVRLPALPRRPARCCGEGRRRRRGSVQVLRRLRSADVRRGFARLRH